MNLRTVDTKGPGPIVRDKSFKPRHQGAKPHGTKPQDPREKTSAPHSSGPKRDRPPPGRPQSGRDQFRDRADPDGPVLLWGMHPVEAALANPARKILKAWFSDNAGRRLEAAVRARGLIPDIIGPKELDRRLGADTVHQGALLEVEPLPDVDLADLIAAASSGKGPLIVLDQVTDPHNVGAILRSAAVFGASGLVMTDRHSPPLAGALAKSASGALELVRIALVPNLSRALVALADEFVATIGLDGEAEDLLEDAALDGPVAIVLGAEGKGLRQLTRDTCDQVRGIAAAGAIASLNVSNAAAIALHLCAMRRRKR